VHAEIVMMSEGNGSTEGWWSKLAGILQLLMYISYTVILDFRSLATPTSCARMGYGTQIGCGALECAINFFCLKYPISVYSITCAKPTHESTVGFSSALGRALHSINVHRAARNPTNQRHLC